MIRFRSPAFRHGSYAVVLASALAMFPTAAVLAQDKPATIELTDEEKKEKELRKACKIELCSAFKSKTQKGGEVACGVLKTWRKEQLAKMVSKGGVSWPWGAARCTANLKFKRDDLIKASTLPEFELAIDKHDIACELDRETDKYKINVEMSPKVQFKDGKAVKACAQLGQDRRANARQKRPVVRDRRRQYVRCAAANRRRRHQRLPRRQVPRGEGRDQGGITKHCPRRRGAARTPLQ